MRLYLVSKDIYPADTPGSEGRKLREKIQELKDEVVSLNSFHKDHSVEARLNHIRETYVKEFLKFGIHHVSIDHSHSSTIYVSGIGLCQPDIQFFFVRKGIG